MSDPAILFEPDGYVITGPRIMGRQSAGHGFLRAAVQGRRGQALWGYTPRRASAQVFGNLLQQIDPTVQAGWVAPHQFARMRELGLLYTPGPGLDVASRLRLRAGIDAYAICGVTHTIASSNAMDEIAGLLTAPIAAWDALICTSTVALETLNSVIAAQADYLAWRLQAPVRQLLPLLPVIPLGVHCDDFEFSAEDRSAARAALSLASDEVAVLFAGRLSPSGKAHPVAMWQGLQAAAERTGRKIAFLQSGRFFTTEAADLYRHTAAQTCPDVRQVVVEGGDDQLYRQAWAAADIFLSLADSVQETFGLTPVEAMAAGLPSVVSDWNGYRDTVRDSLDGFRIPTWSPGPGAGSDIARDHETGAQDYDIYLSRLSTTVSVDFERLTDRLSELVTDGDLRRRLGDSGRRRARELFDWRVVYGQYQALWEEQSALRRAGGGEAAPQVSPSRADPFQTFVSYPTSHIDETTRVTAAAGASRERHDMLAAGLFSLWRIDETLLTAILARLAQGETSMADLTLATGLDVQTLAVTLARLAKMGLVRLAAASPPEG